jgi:hypothetical protein
LGILYQMNKLIMKNSAIYEQLVSEGNIYKAIYSLESYVFEKELLCDNDIELYSKLDDKYDVETINCTIEECRKKLIKAIEDDEFFFDIDVYFKPKKLVEDGNEEYRPMHTADLITQICIVSMLNLIMFDDSDGKRNLSDICKLIPSNFYGNIPSAAVESIFKPWAKQYSDYSTAIINANKEYAENKKFKYEVNLDLEKFFPSIDPAFIYSFIWDKISSFYYDEDKEVLNKILTKLLYFRILFDNKPHDFKEYYKGTEPEIQFQEGITYFNRGIPQGLPQAYLFGNFCMIDVTKIIAEEIDGDAYYYVDDSVIYTNTNEEEFGNIVESINVKLKGKIKLNKETKAPLIQRRDFKSLNKKLQETYTIKIHSYGNGLKTTINVISYQDYLIELARPASTLTFQLKATFEDLEDETLRKKLEALLKYIHIKLKEAKSRGLETQITLLQRYKKFYHYRLRILDYRKDNKITDDTIRDFAIDYDLSPFNKCNFFKKLEDDIFIREAQMLLKYTIDDETKQNEILKHIGDFESQLNKNFKNHYFSKVLSQYPKFIERENSQYATLEKVVRKTVPPYLKSNSEKSREKIKEIISLAEDDIIKKSNSEINIKALFGELNEDEINKCFKFILQNSNEFKRKIYNALFSYILNVPINDGFNLIKMDGRAIHYYELRLLVYLRLNYQFDDVYFRQFAQPIFNDLQNNEEKVDLTLFEVLPIFKKYIGDPKQIDDLILTHRFVNGIWKNGSKFLHFYTLHNEEHSVELIKYCTQITKSIDYLSIKKYDYYILFLACYLHDIAMVIHPNLHEFGKTNDLESELAVTKWKNNLQAQKINENATHSDISKFILETFEVVNDFFEVTIRKEHPKRAAKFIKDQRDLNFLELLTRRVVAEISKGHGFERKDVYGVRSNAKEDVVSEKYMMIILRLADLMDMSKDRVSVNILKQSIRNMPKESQFQWISHLAIDKCTIETEFKCNPIETEEKLEIAENVVFTIYLNTRVLTSIKNANCKKGINCKVSKDYIEIKLEENTCSNCNFMSKWMMKKHSYLFDELISLQTYLYRNSKKSVFNTSFKVILNMSNTDKLPSELIDVVNKKLHVL